jgi:hypothetical protein
MAMNIPGIDPDKLKGGWKMVQDMIADTIGPMAVLGIAAQKFVAALGGAALNAQKMAEALKASDGADRLRQQFEQLLGSSAAAGSQVEMLAKVASGSAFTFDSLADASKNLQVLTNGALNSEQALKKVQDVAAATGAPVDTMATAVADLYSALKSGDGVEAASGQLKNMGAISQETAQRLESLSASGVGLATTWQLVEADLGKANGAASALGGTIAGLQQQLANIQQGSNTKIGEMFAEGEKAGYRAAIGFEKFKSAVAEANAGPWSALLGAIGSIKEAVGNLFGEASKLSAVKAIFQALAVAAIGLLAGAFVPILTIISPIVSGLYKLATATKAVQVAMAGVRTWSQMWAGVTVGITLAGAAVAAFGARIYESTEDVRRLRDEFSKFQKESNEGMAKVASVALGSSFTPEERDSTSKSINEQIAQQQEAKSSAQKNLEQARKDQEGEDMFLGKANPLNIPKIVGGFFNEITSNSQISSADRNIENLMGLQSKLNESAMSDGRMGADAEMLKVSRERLELERQIAREAKQRLGASMTPKAAAEFARGEKTRADQELKFAESQQPEIAKDKVTTENAVNKFNEAGQRRGVDTAGYMDAVNANAKIAEQLGVKAEDLNAPVSPKEIEAANNSEKKFRKSSNAVKAQIKLADSGKADEYRQNQEIINAGLNQSGPLDALDEVGVGLTTEVEKIQADMSRRQALIKEERDAIQATFSADQQPTGAGKDKAREIAKTRLESVGSRIDQLKDYSGNTIGRKGIRGVAIDELQAKLSDAREATDSVKKRSQSETKTVFSQQADEADASNKASAEAAERKLKAQRQINALRGVEGGEGKAAEAELGPEIEQLKKKLAATEALEAAQDAYNNALNAYNGARTSGDRDKIKEAEGKIKEAETNLNQKRKDAMGAGFKDGDTSKSADQELSSVNQILQLRQQEAAITEAAAKRRRDDLMNEIKAANMINQIRVNRLDTKMGNSDANGFNEKKIAEQQQKTNNAGRGLEVAKTVEKLDAQIGGLQDKLKANPDDEEAKSQLDLAQKSKATFEATLGKMFPSGDVSVKGMQKNLDQERKNLEQVKNAPKTERDVQRDELKRQGGDLEKAKGAAEERDAAIKAMDGATSDEERKRLSDVAAKKKEEMASLGVDEGASVQSISKKISQNKQEQQNMLGEDVVNRASVEQDLKLTIARTKEDYGVTREDREQGRKERKDLEDVETKKSLKEQYERMGYKGGKDGEAEKLAEFDTKRKRLQADADEAGNSRVDSFTAIGGGATNSVGVVKDIQKEILDINKQQQDLLDKILQESLAQKALVQGYQPDSPAM